HTLADLAHLIVRDNLPVRHGGHNGINNPGERLRRITFRISWLGRSGNRSWPRYRFFVGRQNRNTANATGFQVRHTTALKIPRPETAAREQQQQSNPCKLLHRSLTGQSHTYYETAGQPSASRKQRLLTTGNRHPATSPLRLSGFPARAIGVTPPSTAHPSTYRPHADFLETQSHHVASQRRSAA